MPGCLEERSAAVRSVAGIGVRVRGDLSIVFRIEFPPFSLLSSRVQEKFRENSDEGKDF